MVSNKQGNKYIRVITRNGGVYPDWFISHDEIKKGSRFTLQLVEKPLLK
jgi:putative alpha-1,2-mannosidase